MQQPLSSLRRRNRSVSDSTACFTAALSCFLSHLGSASIPAPRGWRQPIRSKVAGLLTVSVARLVAPDMPPTHSKTVPVKAAESASKKRKLDATEQKYYAVRAGFKPGVYTTWAICQQQITGFKGAQCACTPAPPQFAFACTSL